MRECQKYVRTRRGLQSEFGPERIAEALDSFIDLIRWGSSKCGAEEHPLLCGVAVGLEPAAARDKDTPVNGGLEDRLLNIGVRCFRREAGVLAPVDFNPVLLLLDTD